MHDDDDTYDYEPIWKFNKKIIRELMKCGFTRQQAALAVEDNHAENIGRTKSGTLKWIDYAGGLSTSGLF